MSLTNPPGSSEQGQPLPVISLQEMVKQSQWSGSLSYEDPQDKKHRLEQEAADAKYKRWRSTSLFGATLEGLAFIFWLGLQTLGNSQASQDDKKWATALVTAIVSGSVGFVTGKAIA